MKKLTFAVLVAVLGLAAVDASARYDRCREACEPCDTCTPCVSACGATECASGVCRVVEEPMPAKPCCERAMVVREEPKLVEHKSYSWECPVTCKVTGYDS